MYRVCLTNEGRLIEMQEGGNDRTDLMDARLDTLRQNAIRAGYADGDIIVKWVTEEEWAVIQEANKPVIPIKEQKRQAYKAEADPLYAEWQALSGREHADAQTRKAEWLAKVAEIEARFQ
jgi:hypothetical protein